MMIMWGLLVLLCVVMVVTFSVLGDRARVPRRVGRQVVMRELAEHYAVENYVLLS